MTMLPGRARRAVPSASAGALTRLRSPAHILAAVGWFGIAVGVASCAIAAAVTDEPLMPVIPSETELKVEDAAAVSHATPVSLM